MEFPRLSPSWQVRNDIRNVLIYKCSWEEHTLRVLSPLQACALPLLDGTHRPAGVVDLLEHALGRGESNGRSRRAMIADAIGSLLATEGAFVDGGTAGPRELSRNMADLIPEFRQYRFPTNRLERPVSVAIAYTNRCCCDCDYCYAERRRCEEVGHEQWCAVLDELAEESVKLVDIGGADILRRHDAFEILAAMVNRGFLFMLSTKSRVTSEEAARMAELGIGLRAANPAENRIVQVSIDAIEPSVGDALVGRPGFVQDTLNSLRTMQKAGLSPRVKGVVTGRNPDAPLDMVPRLAELGVTEFRFVQYGRSYYRHDDSLFLSRDQKLRLREAAHRLTSRFPDIDIRIQDSLEFRGAGRMNWRQWRGRSVCSGGRSNLQIQPNGDATLCEQVPHAPPFVVGNVFDAGVMGVWRSPRLLEFLCPDRSLYAGTACADCPEFDDCHGARGYCYRDAFFSFGTIYEAQPDCPRQTKRGLRVS